MGSLQRVCLSNEPIILMSQVLPVRPAPKIQTRFCGLISDSSKAGAGEPARYSGFPARAIPASTLKNILTPRVIARTVRFLNCSTSETLRRRALPLWEPLARFERPINTVLRFRHGTVYKLLQRTRPRPSDLLPGRRAIRHPLRLA